MRQSQKRSTRSMETILRFCSAQASGGYAVLLPEEEPMTITRGKIWWANLPHPTGSGPGFRHPIVIAQADTFNRSAIRTVIAAVVTANTKLAAAPGNAYL